MPVWAGCTPTVNSAWEKRLKPREELPPAEGNNGSNPSSPEPSPSIFLEDGGDAEGAGRVGVASCRSRRPIQGRWRRRPLALATRDGDVAWWEGQAGGGARAGPGRRRGRDRQGAARACGRRASSPRRRRNRVRPGAGGGGWEAAAAGGRRRRRGWAPEGSRPRDGGGGAVRVGVLPRGRWGRDGEGGAHQNFPQFATF
jgi:hypothetical protein